MISPKNTKKGSFIPKNKDKYKGDPYNIIYRSSWEKRLMNWLDNNINVIQWSSESITIPYIDPMGQQRRYYPDFYVKIKDRNEKTTEYIIEIKPYKQTIEPKIKTKITESYVNEVYTWGVNNAKWKAASEYCRKRKWVFKLMTEKELFKQEYE